MTYWQWLTSTSRKEQRGPCRPRKGLSGLRLTLSAAFFSVHCRQPFSSRPFLSIKRHKVEGQSQVNLEQISHQNKIPHGTGTKSKALNRAKMNNFSLVFFGFIIYFVWNYWTHKAFIENRRLHGIEKCSIFMSYKRYLH